ncbi:hypothetical protein CSA37_01295 [Candidatus Fermentibacteria bacterium]|nr:MAG: hypothetical protein CSA37_09080 [Candidatus Fermentibacteria bacterium]PIE53255.1 MAG: hypothetical protein CSA37_02625 [Candidatus Fermentibacteria bacterium]PIE53484.1 MAG: hypothetical protein CSA37_01295 [Candidatus Fermentibacteria bacterium]
MELKNSSPFRVSISVIAVLLLAVILRLGAPILVKISIALFFALLISPSVRSTTRNVDRLLQKLFKRYRRRGDRSQSNLANVIGTSLVLVMALLLISLFFFLMYGTLSLLVSRKDDMVSNIVHPVVEFVENAQNQWIPGMYDMLGLENVGEVTAETDRIIEGKEDFQSHRPVEEGSFPVASIIPTAAGLVGSVTGFMINTVIITMLTVFMVNGRRLFAEKLRDMDMEEYARYLKVIRAVENVPRKYLMAKLTTSSLTGLLIGAGLVIMGFQVDEAFIWSITAMVLNFVPFFGSIVAGVMIALYVMSLGGFQLGLIAAIMVTVLNNVVSNVIEPNYFGDVLPIGKVTILLCVIVWGYLWGVVGIFLAVPVTIIIKVLLEQTTGRNALVAAMEV